MAFVIIIGLCFKRKNGSRYCMNPKIYEVKIIQKRKMQVSVRTHVKVKIFIVCICIIGTLGFQQSVQDHSKSKNQVFYNNFSSDKDSIMPRTNQELNNDTIKAFIDQYIPNQLEKMQIPGASICIVVNDSIIFEEGYGYADLSSEIPMSASETMLRLGSLTSLFTWTGIMQLFEQNHLELDKDIHPLLEQTSIRIDSILNNSITLNQLMAHTAGFEDTLLRDTAINLNSVLELETYLAQNTPIQLYQPNTVMAYSNYGVSLAGFLLELLSDTDYCDYITENIFNPLNMTRSRIQNGKIEEENIAKGYTNKNNKNIETEPAIVNILPAKGMYSTASEIGHFIQAHLNAGDYHGKSILTRDTVSLMHQKHFDMNATLTTGWAHGFMNQRYRNYSFLTHYGDCSGFTSQLTLLLDQNVGIFLGYNRENIAEVRTEFLHDFIDTFFSTSPVTVLSDSVLTTAELKHFRGEYQTTRRVESQIFSINNVLSQSLSISIKNGKFLVINGDEQFIAVGEHLFRHITEDYYLEFKINEEKGTLYAIFENDGIQVYEKMNGIRSPGFHRFSGVILLFIVATTLLISSFQMMTKISHVVRKKNKSNPNQKMWKILKKIPISHLYLPVSWIIAIMLLLATLGIVIQLETLEWSQSGANQTLLKLILTVPLIARIFSFFNLVLVFNLWIDRKESLLVRLYYSCFELATFGYLFWLYYWKLLGYNI